MLSKAEVLSEFGKSVSVDSVVKAVISSMANSETNPKNRKKIAAEYVERIIYEDWVAMAEKTTGFAMKTKNNN